MNRSLRPKNRFTPVVVTQRPGEPERWITVKHFIALYGYSDYTVREWIKTGELRSVKRGAIRYVLDPRFFDNIPLSLTEQNDPEFATRLRGQEVAQIMGLSSRRIRQLAEAGQIGYRLRGRNRRYSIGDIRKLIKLRKGSQGAAAKTRQLIVEWAKNRLKQKS